ncbi:MAG: hypothetical protein QM817_38700 [Archangium sp.]
MESVFDTWTREDEIQTDLRRAVDERNDSSLVDETGGRGEVLQHEADALHLAHDDVTRAAGVLEGDVDIAGQPWCAVEQDGLSAKEIPAPTCERASDRVERLPKAVSSRAR